jgi:hypothetical protein
MRCLRCCLPPTKRRYVVANTATTGLKHIDICLFFNLHVMFLPGSFALLSLLSSLLLPGWLRSRSHLPCAELNARPIIFMRGNFPNAGVNIAIARATGHGSKLCLSAVSSPGPRPHYSNPPLPLLAYQHCHENENHGLLIISYANRCDRHV